LEIPLKTEIDVEGVVENLSEAIQKAALQTVPDRK
jgi:hypothetical protein